MRKVTILDRPFSEFASEAAIIISSPGVAGQRQGEHSGRSFSGQRVLAGEESTFLAALGIVSYLLVVATEYLLTPWKNSSKARRWSPFYWRGHGAV